MLQREPKFRRDQAERALLNPAFSCWEDITVLPKNLRDNINKNIPWISVKEKNLQKSKIDKSQKVALELQDGNLIETILMKNAKGNATICVSSQIGCQISCAFCNTGKMGFKRNLTKNEIVDQYRFWMYKKYDINNIVFMGTGEPFLNYENVRSAIIEILKYSKIGKNHIVVSTVGIIEKLNNMLDDGLWPNVRLAISLHSAVQETRAKLIPIHTKNFFNELVNWSEKYHQKFGGRNLYLSIEYTLLRGVNDSIGEAATLTKFIKKLGRVKVNLIPYNQTACNFNSSRENDILKFQNIIQKAGFVCILRKSLGADIRGACGQLTAKNIAL